MAIQGKILAIQLATPQTVTSLTGGQEQSGYQVILSVRSILAKVQTTILSGVDLLSVGRMTNFPPETVFPRYVDAYKNKPMTWAQLSTVPNPATPYTVNIPAQPPIATGTLTVLDSGWDPIWGCWIEFKGNYFLHFPLFKDWASLVVRDGPDYRGFQPSMGSGRGTGSGGSGSGNCGR